MQRRIKAFVVSVVFLLAVALPFASASVTLGGNGTVTLTNPDNSTFVFTSTNQTTYSYVSNANDGWWNLVVVDDNSDLMILAVVILLAVIGFAVFAVVRRNK